MSCFNSRLEPNYNIGVVGINISFVNDMLFGNRVWECCTGDKTANFSMSDENQLFDLESDLFFSSIDRGLVTTKIEWNS